MDYAESSFSLRDDGQDSPCLLEESFALDSNVSLADSVGDGQHPFPLDRQVPLTRVLSLARNLSMFPRGKPGFQAMHDPSRVVIAAPTAPRLKTMMTETLCIRQWVVNNGHAEAAPGHIPWADNEEGQEDEPTEPEYLQDMLESRTKQAAPSRVVSPIVRRRASCHPIARPLTRRGNSNTNRNRNRRAAVLDEEITVLNTENGKQRRWSLEIPEPSTSPKMANVMLDLQDLNSFFKDGLKDVDDGLKELAGHLAPNTTLATRRGKKALPIIAVPPAVEAIRDPAFDNIPTALRGTTPSAYSPKFNFAPAPQEGEASMDLDEMVATLRKKVVDTRVAPDTRANEPVTLPRDRSVFALVGENLPDNSVVQEGDSDEWAFADSLMAKFGPGKTDTSAEEEDGKKVDIGKHVPVIMVTTPLRIAKLVLAPVSAVLLPSQNLAAHNNVVASLRPPLPMKPRRSPELPASRPPSLPLPLRPCTASSSRVRGIVKSKNVRFAAPPRSHMKVEVVIAQEYGDGEETKAAEPEARNVQAIVHRTVPLTSRMAPSPQSITSRTRRQASAPFSAYPAPRPSRITSAPLPMRSAPRAVAPTNTGDASKQPSPLRTSLAPPSNSNNGPVKKIAVVPEVVVKKKGSNPMFKSLLNRPATSPTTTANKPRPSVVGADTPPFPTDENAVRRSGRASLGKNNENVVPGSVGKAGIGSTGTQSRMPVPLRNILTRFK